MLRGLVDRVTDWHVIVLVSTVRVPYATKLSSMIFQHVQLRQATSSVSLWFFMYSLLHFVAFVAYSVQGIAARTNRTWE